MILIEIPDNANCAAVELRVFHDVELAQPAGQVRLSRDGGSPQWYDVTGWTADDHPCPAWLQKVDDSGDGVAFLLHGGDAGVRLRPADARQPWNRGASRQWGEPFLIMGDRADVRLEVPAPAGRREGIHG